MPSPKQIVHERQHTHGDFSSHAVCTQKLKDLARQCPNWDKLAPVHKEALEMILFKVGRVLTGDPSFKDHWDDIAGYAQLGSAHLEG